MNNSQTAKKNVVLFFGTFNPIHIGHLIIAEHARQLPNIAETWLVVSPKNPHKEKHSLLADHHRLYMAKLATEDNFKLRVSDVEFALPKPSYTALTLVHLKELYPNYNFILLLGEDNLLTFHKWKNYEEILNNHEILVYPRNAEGVSNSTIPKILESFSKRISFLQAPLLHISATYIRQCIQAKKSTKYLLTEPVARYIDEMRFYLD
jgi:nicotinate-nucleotide adenylyltransferase